MSKPIWSPRPDSIASTNIDEFRLLAEKRAGIPIRNYADLHRWSTTQAPEFWSAVWDWSGMIASVKGNTVVSSFDKMLETKWFPEARLNFAENLLRRRDDALAIAAWREGGRRRALTFRELYDEVSRVAQMLRGAGIKQGDVVAGWLPTIPEAVVAMLATTSLGGIWCSCSPDFGVQGVIDRFGQVEPKVLFAADGYEYNGVAHDCLDRLGEIAARLPSVEKIVVVPYNDSSPSLKGLPNASLWSDSLAGFDASTIDFVQLPFDHPVYVLFTSGTTGKPKCLVHGSGGSLLKHASEHGLHFDVKRDDKVYYYTTLGWAMWNWLVSVLARGATMVTYDGSPFHPAPIVQFDIAAAERVALFGTSARFIDSIRKAGLKPMQTHDLSSVRAIGSTGSPLVDENYSYVYRCVKDDACLASFAGGTDILGSFVGGEPTNPIWSGEIQTACLGMDVDIFDEHGNSCDRDKGELVCKRAFPSMPVYFWKDENRDKYRQAYFSKFDNVWCQGDLASKSDHGGYIIYGRSDAVLNPGGVRIGTAEIYQQIEKLEEVLESVAIAHERDGDVRIVLFVRIAGGATLDEALRNKIRDKIRRNTTPRHVPALIIQVEDIPRTMNGKIAEIAVRDTIHGRTVNNTESLANPQALKEFQHLRGLE